MASRKGRRLAAGVVMVIGAITLVVLASQTFVISDTAEDIWPDPRDRQGVYLRTLGLSLQAFARDHGGLPDSLGALFTGLAAQEAGPRAKVHRDVWGTPVRYLVSGLVYEVRSAGPDRLFETDDDIAERGGTTYSSKKLLYDSARAAAGKPR